MVRVRFAGVTSIRRDSLRCGMWLTRRVRSKRWVHRARYAPRCYVYQFELRSPRDLTTEIRRYLREAYDVGCQRHLIRPGKARRATTARASRAGA